MYNERDSLTYTHKTTVDRFTHRTGKINQISHTSSSVEGVFETISTVNVKWDFYAYLPNPTLGQDMTQDQFSSGV